MKNILFLVGFLISINITGQNQKQEQDATVQPRLNIEESIYIGESINEFLSRNVQYPKKSIDANIQGTEIIQFTVSPEGRLTKYKVLNSLGPEIDKEMFRVLKLTNGKWKPGTANGEAVAMVQEVSVNFLLYPAEFIVAWANDYLQKGNKWMFAKHNPRKAIYFYNKGITLLPNNETLLAARGLCKYKIGDQKGANRDWERLNVLAKRNEIVPKQEELVEKSDNSQIYNEITKALESSNLSK
jgi:tetratricopeptide (TPR) repeat protein